MAFEAPLRPRGQIRAILSSTALLSFTSVRKAAALAVPQLGMAAFFIAGPARSALGESAVWFVAAATVLAGFARASEIEGWALFIPGGAVGRVRQAFGPRAARAAAAASLVDRLLLTALACLVVGHYAASVAITTIVGWSFASRVSSDDLATLVAVSLIGLLWIRARLGLDVARDAIAKGVWVGVVVLLITLMWGLGTVVGRATPLEVLASLPHRVVVTNWPSIDTVLTCLFGLALALPVLGSGDALAQAAHELPPPRVPALRRAGRLTLLFSILVTTAGTFLFVLLVPGSEQRLWGNAPLVGLAQHIAGPIWVLDLVALAIVGAAALLLLAAAHVAFGGAEQLLERLAGEGILSERLAFRHPRFGTPSRALAVAAAATVLIVLASGGRVAWLSRAYAIAIATNLAFSAAALTRLRRTQPAVSPFKVPLTLRIAGYEVPTGLLGPGLLAMTSVVALTVVGDVPSIATIGMLGTLMLLFIRGGHTAAELPASPDEPDAFDLLPAADLSLDHVDVKPGGVLVPVRNPHSLAHVVAALDAARDRDVIVMTVRLLGVDVAEDASTDTSPTLAERRLLTEVVAVAERSGRPVRLLVVPAHNVFDAIVATIQRVQSSDVHVGESSSLSADEQARLLGDAWERTARSEPLDVRLVVYHRSGRSDTYHLGAHPPSLTHGDLDLIHRIWLDATRAIGPHVHHHDVVRGALTQMEQQLNGPRRDEALSAIRQVARLAEELASVLRARDYARLRDMMRNRHAGDVAALLTELGLEDQAIVFRVLPRKDAAAVFEYLSQDAQEALLKAMAQEDVAALLNNMAPDDRTIFLEELPANVTRHLLSLLTPEERAVALTLLGYPERSIGRLMTPHYVSVREHFTVREVLDYVRAHGQDSETLNVIYVVDDQGLLIDDIRIREFLLSALDRKVADLMDRRFVALKATDDQQAAVAVFRQYDRSALPVTDSAGMLIGIVTIDDVLDVAEATATREIQRIGGSEALDEPYISIAFTRMIQKRAGWLTALFLGEMLTATAMGFFEAEISRAVVLAMFVPLIISSGGNSGSQASTLVIRALALEEVRLKDWWRVMRREILAGVSLGAILGTIGFLRIALWSAFSDMYGAHWLLVALTVAISLVGVVLWGTLTGSLLPFLLRRLGFDPAVSSAPFVATLVDVTGLVIYFSVAAVVLRGTLL